MEQGIFKRDISITKISPGQKIEFSWFERDCTHSGIGIVRKVTASTVKVVLERVLSAGSNYKIGQEVQVKRVSESIGRATLSVVRLIEEQAFRHKDFL